MPEGLPVSISISLLIVAAKLSKKKILVKRLASIETLGCVNVLLSDKTGTLTQNQLSVVSVSLGINECKIEDTNDKFLKTLFSICFLCNDASFEPHQEEKKTNEKKAKGDSVDIALLKFSYDSCSNIKDFYTQLHEVPFNSSNKWMAKLFTKTKSEASDIGNLGSSENYIFFERCTRHCYE